MAERNKKRTTRPGRLRIVAGNWRSRLLDVADVPGLRPTSERIRETLFNWLGSAYSRGELAWTCSPGPGRWDWRRCRAVPGPPCLSEQSAPAVKTLRANVASLGAETADVRQMDAMDYLRAEHARRFDIVFLDPPFAAGKIVDICRCLDERDVLATRCANLYRAGPFGRRNPDFPTGWRVLKDKTAGNVRYMLVQSGA